MPTAIEEMSAETIQLLAKSVAGLIAGSGPEGVDLTPFTSQVPVLVTARNNTAAFPREVAGMGSPNATWQTFLNVNNQQTDAAVGVNRAGSETLFQVQNVMAPYVPLGKAGLVTLDAIAQSQGYADALAKAEMGVLNQLYISQDIHIINSQAYPLVSIAEPTATSATSGGSIDDSTDVVIKVAARSGWNWYYGGSGIASSARTIETGSSGSNANSVTADVEAVPGAAGYDWFVGGYYYTTTSVNTVTITDIPTANQPVPADLRIYADLSSVAPVAVPTVDGSWSANCYNGVVASTLGDYGTTGPTTPGAGTPTGSTFITLDGAQPIVVGSGIDVLDQMCAQVFGVMKLSPNAFMMNSQQASDFSQLVLGTSAATTFLPPTDADGRTNLVGGGFVGRYINRAAGGVAVPVEVHPHVAPGTVIARTDRVPFPDSGIGSVFGIRCQYDTRRFDYASNRDSSSATGGPRYEFEIRSNETLMNRAPGAQVIAGNIGAINEYY